MPSQTVFRLTSRDCFDGLEAFKEPIPSVGKYEVLVRVRSVSLNYRDVAIATSTYPLPVKDQVIPCSDMAGEVAQVGDFVTEVSVGDSILAPISVSLLYGLYKNDTDTFGGPKDGMLRGYIALPAHAIVKTAQVVPQLHSVGCFGSYWLDSVECFLWQYTVEAG
jgi:NADPH:quinone reductase-like Zn-dependent oxidoreductase